MAFQDRFQRGYIKCFLCCVHFICFAFKIAYIQVYLLNKSSIFRVKSDCRGLTVFSFLYFIFSRSLNFNHFSNATHLLIRTKCKLHFKLRFFHRCKHTRDLIQGFGGFFREFLTQRRPLDRKQSRYHFRLSLSEWRKSRDFQKNFRILCPLIISTLTISIFPIINTLKISTFSIISTTFLASRKCAYYKWAQYSFSLFTIYDEKKRKQVFVPNLLC